MCPYFGHPALTSSFTEYEFLEVKNNFATILTEVSVLKLFQLSNGDLLFSLHAYSNYKVRKPKMTKLGQGVEVRAHYPIETCSLRFETSWYSGKLSPWCSVFSTEELKILETHEDLLYYYQVHDGSFVEVTVRSFFELRKQEKIVYRSGKLV